ncbi:MAG: Lrp/AsnC family transcriptional regulator [Candidatus Heimdallarchaeota archaeon]|nr:Lrp/AsnC family transcriptional regulator [Candidatus Heimdallarchaeota archaeon]
MEKTEAIKLDELDFKLLRELKTNSRRSIRQFAKAIKENPSTVYNRLNRLESTGVIKKWAVALDYSLLNLDVVFYVFVSVECEGSLDSDLKFDTMEVSEQLKKVKGICEITLMTGDFDIFVKLRTDSLESAAEIIMDQIRIIPGVSKIVSHNCYETILCECDVNDVQFPVEIKDIKAYGTLIDNSDMMTIYGENH